MPKCKKCGSADAIKNGIVAGKQRYKCKSCRCNFREGDCRTNEKTAAKKALCILLYAMTKGSYRMLGRILGIDHTLVYRWVGTFGKSLPEPKISGEIKQMEFDELWHFIGNKKTGFESSKPLTVIHGEPWPGFPAVVILQHSNGFTTKSGA